jgi:hypothetical protein
MLRSSLSSFSWYGIASLAWGVVCAALAVGAVVRLVSAADMPSNEEALRAHGLFRSGRIWCLPEETDLRDRLNGLDRLEQRLLGAQQSVDQLIGQNERLRTRLAQVGELEKQLRQLASAAKPGSAQRIQLDAQMKAAEAEQLRRQYVPSAQLGLSAPLKPAMSDLIIVRNDLMLRLLPLLEAMDRLTQHYDSLQQDHGVIAALASLSPPEKLGPSKGFRDTWKIVDKLQPMVFSEGMPVSREGRFYRVTAIVNERQPLTFCFLGTGEPTLIPQNLAEAAGLTIDPKALRIKLRVARGRQETAWPMKVPRLRFGRAVLHDVDAYILAPEAADMGARIGASAFSGYRVQLDVDRLLLTVGDSK